MTTTPAIRLKFSKKQGSWYPQSQFSDWQGEKSKAATMKKLAIITLREVILESVRHSSHCKPRAVSVAKKSDENIAARGVQSVNRYKSRKTSFGKTILCSLFWIRKSLNVNA